MFSYTQPREAILDHHRWFLRVKDSWESAAIAEGQRHGKGIIARLDGVTDCDLARELIGADIAIERGALPEPEDGRYYWSDLEGMRVVHRDGSELGRVAYLFETGANDVLVTEGERQRLIPFVVGQVILDVDFAAGVISVDWEWD